MCYQGGARWRELCPSAETPKAAGPRKPPAEFGKPREELPLPAQQTHCKRGHEFTPENSLPQSQSAYGERACRACQRERDRLWQAKRYHSLDPETRRKISVKLAKAALLKRKRRAKTRSLGPVDIDRIVREELSGGTV